MDKCFFDFFINPHVFESGIKQFLSASFSRKKLNLVTHRLSKAFTTVGVSN